MQTIASLASRLEMTPEEAVGKLKQLGFDVHDVQSEISGDQIDVLIEIDEDPAALDKYLSEKRKKEEQARKRTERLQQANAKKKKAAAKTAAKKAPAKKKAATIEPEEVAAVEQVPKAEIVILPAEEETVAPPEAEIAAEPVEQAEEAERPAVEILPPVEEKTPEPEPATVPVPPAPVTVAPKAEILPDEPPAPPSETELEEGEEPVLPPAGPQEPLGALAEAERRHEEEEKRRQLKRVQAQNAPATPRTPDGRPLPTPDPDVVAAVIRRAAEKDRQRQMAEQRARGERPTGPRGDRPGAPREGGPGGRFGTSPFNRDAMGSGGARPRPGEARPDARTSPAPALGEGKPGMGERKGPVGVGKAAKKKQKRAERARVLEETLRRDAAAAVREFTAGGALGGARRKKKRRSREEDGLHEDEMSGGVLEVSGPMTVEQISAAMGWPVNEIILELMNHDILATKNQVLDFELIRDLAEGHGWDVITAIPEEEDLLREEPDNPEDLQLRAPVITVMGHVDHGKTSFLDAVRSANVVAGEAGGITQHIAAYDVQTPNGRVAFLDTPGHEAFTQMRARGSQVTDIVVLVVAADDGVKPQTVEAIHHAKAANVPIVVAVNKIDKPGAQPDRVRQELTQYELVDEAWGGNTIIRNISAHTKEGIPELLELLVLQAELLELKANPNKRARATVLESEISKGQGPVAWVLVQNGTLRVGDIFLAGTTHGRVRTITTSKGEPIQEAGPSVPVLVTGFNDPPDAGDSFIVLEEERLARSIASKRAQLNKQQRGGAAKPLTLEDFHERMLAGEQKQLNIIVKADVQGSVDVLESSLTKAVSSEVAVNIVHSGVGGINESDVMLASASNAVIIGFHVVASPKVQKLAEQEGVDIRTYLVIYEAIDEIRSALEGMLAPDVKEVVVGHAEIRHVFRSSALGNIAGCMQVDGETERGSRARVLRDSVVVYDGKIASVRRNKDDVKSVQTGFECGIKLERFEDIQSGDVIETYRLENVAKTLTA